MKLMTGIIAPILSEIALAIGFIVRCMLAQTCGSPSRSNLISFSRSIRERLGNILSMRKIIEPFAVQVPKFADQVERNKCNITECFYKPVFNIMTNGSMLGRFCKPGGGLWGH